MGGEWVLAWCVGKAAYRCVGKAAYRPGWLQCGIQDVRGGGGGGGGKNG